MMTNKLKIPYAEFYITNVCNLTCAGCNHFNDVKFRGCQEWSDYADQYSAWSQIVEFDHIAILGGEPLLNPSFMSWLSGITTLWNRTRLRVITNGFRLNFVPGLYDMISKNKKIQIWVGIHNKMHKKEIFNEVAKFMSGPITYEYGQHSPYREYVWCTDSNGVRIKIEYNWWFNQGSIKKQENILTLHTSDPVRAHEICNMKTCHQFIKGKLYKCGVVGLLEEFDQQFPLTLSPGDRTLMNAYQPLTLDHSHEQKSTFIQNLDKPIDQCRFCPEAYHGEMIYSQKKLVKSND
jgi:hypothetical protein